MKKLPITQENS